MDAAGKSPPQLEASPAFHAGSCSALLAESLRRQATYYADVAADLDEAFRKGTRPSDESLAAAMALANALSGEAFTALEDTDRLNWLEQQFPLLSLIHLHIQHEFRGAGYGVRAAIDNAITK